MRIIPNLFVFCLKSFDFVFNFYYFLFNVWTGSTYFLMFHVIVCSLEFCCKSSCNEWPYQEFWCHLRELEVLWQSWKSTMLLVYLLVSSKSSLVVVTIFPWLKIEKCCSNLFRSMLFMPTKIVYLPFSSKSL